MKLRPAVLVVDDEKSTREGLRAALEETYEVFVARDAGEAARIMADVPPDAVVTDLRMAGEDGMTVIDRALRSPGRPVCVMMTAYGDIDTAVEAMRRGAYDFLQKPLDLRRLQLVLERGLRARSTEEELDRARTRLDRKFSLGEVVGSSPALLAAVERVRQVAPSSATVLLTGETGTGKELFAQMIHQNSRRSKGPFVAVHCAAIPANLLESELFGHEKGAFTGAHDRRTGRFEAADGGTLFLDEIGEIDAATQVKLLRFLESRSIERLGSHKPVALDLRLVCATNRDLEAMVRDGKFREDLFYRLSVVPLRLPSLRERREDIPLLMSHYLRRFAAENAVEPPRLTPPPPPPSPPMPGRATSASCATPRRTWLSFCPEGRSVSATSIPASGRPPRPRPPRRPPAPASTGRTTRGASSARRSRAPAATGPRPPS